MQKEQQHNIHSGFNKRTREFVMAFVCKRASHSAAHDRILRHVEAVAGDAVLHALTDAVLGAAGLDDLGTLFPDTDPRYQGADSTTLLRTALQQVAEQGLRCWSIDLAIQCDRPRIAPRRAEIRAHLAQLFELPLDRVNLKGKTREGVGSEVEAVDVTAVVLLGPAA